MSETISLYRRAILATLMMIGAQGYAMSISIFSYGAAYLTKTMSFGDVILFDCPRYGNSEGSPNAVDFEIASSAIKSVT